jgi:NitT/TauT family transport system ATP-binding protein
VSEIEIEIRGLDHEFQVASRSHQALLGVDLDVAKGEFVVVVGPSGCGKSTLLDLIGGLTRPSGGEIKIDGVSVDGPGLDRGVVFQQYALLPWKSALGNVEFSLRAAGSPKQRRGRREKAKEYLRLVGLERFGDRYPHELSGGMKQRVAIARSLAYEPRILLMDEPFAALDAQTRESLQDELLRIWEQTGATIVFITHSIEEAVYLGRRVAVMTAGPGRIKEIIEVPILSRGQGSDVRAAAEFSATRHLVWESLHDEVAKAAVLQYDGPEQAAPNLGSVAA